MDILLDPYVVQMPKPLESKAHLIEYLTSLSEWSKLLFDPHDNKIWFSEPALQALWETDQFPIYSKLSKVISELNDDNFIFDATTVSLACGRMNEPPFIDEEIFKLCPDVENILPDEKQTIIIPDEIRCRLQPSIAAALMETFIKLAFIHEHYQISIFENMLFATRALNDLDEQIEINSQCIHIESGKSFSIHDEWISVNHPLNLIDDCFIQNNWHDTNKMVKWAYEDLINQEVIDKMVHKLPKQSEWKIGQKFLKSIEENHFDNPKDIKRIYFSMIKILTHYWPRGVNSQKNHILQRDNAQILRKNDGGLAWRAYVTQCKPKVRLHYWLIGEKVEFSVVVPHGTYTIE